MVRTRARSGAVVASTKGKRSGGRRARTAHYNALPESVRGSTGFYRQGRPRSRMEKIALRGSKRRTRTQTARHSTTAQTATRHVRHKHGRHGRPTHRARQGADRRKTSAYCLRAYKAPRVRRNRQRVVRG